MPDHQPLLVPSLLWHGEYSGILYKVPFHTFVGAAKKRTLRLKPASNPTQQQDSIDVAVVSGESKKSEIVKAALPLALIWGDPKSQTDGYLKPSFLNARKKDENEILLLDIERVSTGIRTDAFRAFIAKNGRACIPHESCCFSIVGAKRSVDFYVSSPGAHATLRDAAMASVWKESIQSLLDGFHRMHGTIHSTIQMVHKWDARLHAKSLFEAAKCGDLAAIRWYFEHGCPVDFMDAETGDTVLIFACRLGLYDVARLALIQYHASNDPHPSYGQTALQVGVSSGHIEIVRLVLETAEQSGSDKVITNHEDENGEAPIHVAARCGSIEILELLFDHGGDLGLVDGRGRTVLHCAAQAGQAKCLLFALESGAEELLEAREYNGFTCLHLAVRANKIECVEYLLDAGADVYAETRDGSTAYDIALKQRNQGIAKLLLECDVSETESDSVGYDKDFDLLQDDDCSSISDGDNMFSGLNTYSVVDNVSMGSISDVNRRTSGFGMAPNLVHPGDLSYFENTHHLDNHPTLHYANNTLNTSPSTFYSSVGPSHAGPMVSGSSYHEYVSCEGFAFTHAGDTWQTFTTHDGYPYFYNVDKDTSTWNDPRDNNALCLQPQTINSGQLLQSIQATSEPSYLLSAGRTDFNRGSITNTAPDQMEYLHLPKGTVAQNSNNHLMPTSASIRATSEQTIGSDVTSTPPISKSPIDTSSSASSTKIFNASPSLKSSCLQNNSIPKTGNYSTNAFSGPPSDPRRDIISSGQKVGTTLQTNDNASKSNRSSKQKELGIEPKSGLSSTQKDLSSRHNQDEISIGLGAADVGESSDSLERKHDDCKFKQVGFKNSEPCQLSRACPTQESTSQKATVYESNTQPHSQPEIDAEEFAKMTQDSIRVQEQKNIVESISGVSQTPTAQTSTEAGAKTETDTVTVHGTKTYEKYKRMISVGVPLSAVCHKMTQDGVSDQEVEKFVASNGSIQSSTVEALPKSIGTSKEILMKDPALAKYVKMKEVGVPEPAIQQKMVKDGIDNSKIKLFCSFCGGQEPDSGRSTENHNLEKKTNLPPQSSTVEALPKSIGTSKEILMKDPALAKYVKMKEVGVPEPAILQKMAKDGIDNSKIKLFCSFCGGQEPNSVQPTENHNLEKKTNLPPQSSTVETLPKSIGTLKEKIMKDPALAKYVKMKEVGVPEPAIQQKMVKDGIDNSKIKLFCSFCGGQEPDSIRSTENHNLEKKTNFPPPSGLPPPPTVNHDGQTSSCIPTKDQLMKDESVSKYVKMVSFGVPPTAVVVKMQAENICLTKIEAFKVAFGLEDPNSKSSSLPPLPQMRRRASKALQKIHWSTPSEEKLKNSLWVSQSSDDADINDSEVQTLESLFSVSPKNKSTVSVGTKKAIQSKKETTSVIDPKRANNIAISLAQFRAFRDYRCLCQAVASLDDQNLSAEKLQNMKVLLPTSEEIRQLNGYNSKSDGLGRAELFFLAVMEIPRFAIKLNCFIFFLQFDNLSQSLTSAMKTLKNACNEVIGSKKLASLLRRLLAIGNLFNESCGRPKAQGITLESILKTAQKRSSDGKTNVLDHLVSTALNNKLDLVHFWADMPTVRDAMRMDLEEFNSSLREIEVGVRNVENSIKKEQESEYLSEISQNFLQRLEPFSKASLSELNSIRDDFKQVEDCVQRLCSFFAEDSKTCKASKIFCVLLDLSRLVETSTAKHRRKEKSLRRKRIQQNRRDENPSSNADTKI